MIKTAAMQAGSEIVLRGKKFRRGTGVQNQQLRDFADGVEVPDNRLGYSTSFPFVLRYKAFAAGSGERGHPVAAAVWANDKGERCEGGYHASVAHTTLDELRNFVVTNRGVPNINIGYEAVAGEEGVIDIASCIAFDLDVKM